MQRDCTALLWPVVLILTWGVLATTEFPMQAAPAAAATEVSIKGSMVCNGACVPDPKADDHIMVVFAIDGTSDIQAEVEKIMTEFYPDRGLDGDAAQRLMDQFTARLKYYVSPDSPALKDAKEKKNHYCMPAVASTVTGTVCEKDGRNWIVARKIEPAVLRYPDKMYLPDKPFVWPDEKPLLLRINDKLVLTCVPIPPGRFLMGTPFYLWPYFQEEYPHMVTLTKPFYLSEIPITQEIYETIMGNNPSTVKDPRVPVQDPPFADVEKFCRFLSERTGRKVRLPSDAEWEYAARVGTSNPGFREKYKHQDSSGSDGFKKVLPVKSKQPNAWGLYDMASCWWEITGDRGMYNVRHSEVDPRYPPPEPETARSQRNGRGLLKEGWSIITHEFITENGYAGQKFRVVVEAEQTKITPRTVKRSETK